MSGNGTVKPLPTPSEPKARPREVTQVELNLYSALLGREPTIDPETGADPRSDRVAERVSAPRFAQQFAQRLKHPALQPGLAAATRRLLEAWARIATHRPAAQGAARLNRHR